MQSSLFGSAVPEETDRDLVSLVNFSGETRATGERRPAADDAVGTEHALIHVRDVHRPALAFAGTGGFPEQLGHHAPRLHPFSHAVAMAAMSRSHVVGVGQVRADADRYCLLSSVEVDKA